MNRSPTISIVYPVLPPACDAIGEYTANLCQELASNLHVELLTSDAAPCQPIEGVNVEACFRLQGADRFARLRDRLATTSAAAVVVQYNPFSWGRRGWAPDLVDVLRIFKRNRPDVRLAVMFHETYMSNPGWRAWVMRQYQRRQYRKLVSLADIGFFSTEAWGDQVQRHSPGANVVHAPVGSNLPESQASPVETRVRWGIGHDDFVCGVFGGAHPSRLIDWIKSAVRRINTLQPDDRRVVLLHVGGQAIDWSGTDVPIVATGRLVAPDAADAIATMDLLINPFRDGISTRRGSAIAALQQGVPILSTKGPSTDALWTDVAGTAVFLAPADDVTRWDATVDSAADYITRNRDTATTAARRGYQRHFAWPVVADRFRAHLFPDHVTAPPSLEAVESG